MPFSTQCYSSTSSLDSNVWTHVAVVIDKNNDKIQFYRNNNLEGDFTVSGLHILDNSSNILIGKNNNNEYFNGYLDDIRVYERPISASEVLELYKVKRDQSLLLRYDFEQYDYTNDLVYDESGYANHGTLYNKDGVVEDDFTSNIGNYAVKGTAFNADVDQYITIASNTTIQSSNLNNCTFSAWIKTSSLTSFEPIIHKDGVFSFGLDNGHATLRLGDGTTLHDLPVISAPTTETTNNETNQTTSNLTTNLIGSFTFNAPKDVENDYSSFSNDLVVQKPFEVVDGHLDGSTALYFSSAQHVELDGSAYSNTDMNTMSFSAWIKPDNITGEQPIFSRQGLENKVKFCLSNSDLYLAIQNVDNPILESVTASNAFNVNTGKTNVGVNVDVSDSSGGTIYFVNFGVEYNNLLQTSILNFAKANTVGQSFNIDGVTTSLYFSRSNYFTSLTDTTPLSITYENQGYSFLIAEDAIGNVTMSNLDVSFPNLPAEEFFGINTFSATIDQTDGITGSLNLTTPSNYDVSLFATAYTSNLTSPTNYTNLGTIGSNQQNLDHTFTLSTVKLFDETVYDSVKVNEAHVHTFFAIAETGQTSSNLYYYVQNYEYNFEEAVVNWSSLTDGVVVHTHSGTSISCEISKNGEHIITAESATDTLYFYRKTSDTPTFTAGTTFDITDATYVNCKSVSISEGGLYATIVLQKSDETGFQIRFYSRSGNDWSEITNSRYTIVSGVTKAGNKIHMSADSVYVVASSEDKWYLFKLENNEYSLLYTYTYDDSDGNKTYFGLDVTVSSLGDVGVGAQNDNCAWIFTKVSDTEFNKLYLAQSGNVKTVNLSSDGLYYAVHYTSGIKVYKKSTTWSGTEVDTITFGTSSCENVGISGEGKYIVVGLNTSLVIYKNDGNDSYSIEKTLTTSKNQIYVDMSYDAKYIISSEITGNEVEVFKTPVITSEPSNTNIGRIGVETPYPTIQTVVYDPFHEALDINAALFSAYDDVTKFYVAAFNSNISGVSDTELINYMIAQSNTNAVEYGVISHEQFKVLDVFAGLSNVFSDMNSNIELVDGVSYSNYTVKIVAEDDLRDVNLNSNINIIHNIRTDVTSASVTQTDGLKYSATFKSGSSNASYYTIATTNDNLTLDQIKEYVTTNYGTYQTAINTSNLNSNLTVTITDDVLTNIVDLNNNIKLSSKVNFANVYLYGKDTNDDHDIDKFEIRPASNLPYITVFSGEYNPFYEQVTLTSSLFSGYYDITKYYVVGFNSNLDDVSDSQLYNYIVADSNSSAVYFNTVSHSQYEILDITSTLSNVYSDFSSNIEAINGIQFSNYNYRIIAEDNNSQYGIGLYQETTSSYTFGLAFNDYPAGDWKLVGYYDNTEVYDKNDILFVTLNTNEVMGSSFTFSVGDYYYSTKPFGYTSPNHNNAANTNSPSIPLHLQNSGKFFLVRSRDHPTIEYITMEEGDTEIKLYRTNNSTLETTINESGKYTTGKYKDGSKTYGTRVVISDKDICVNSLTIQHNNTTIIDSYSAISMGRDFYGMTFTNMYLRLVNTLNITDPTDYTVYYVLSDGSSGSYTLSSVDNEVNITTFSGNLFYYFYIDSSAPDNILFGIIGNIKSISMPKKYMSKNMNLGSFIPHPTKGVKFVGTTENITIDRYNSSDVFQSSYTSTDTNVGGKIVSYIEVTNANTGDYFIASDFVYGFLEDVNNIGSERTNQNLIGDSPLLISSGSAFLNYHPVRTDITTATIDTTDGLKYSGDVKSGDSNMTYYSIGLTDPNLTLDQVKEYVTTNYSTYQTAINTSNINSNVNEIITDDILTNIVDIGNNIVTSKAVNFTNTYLYGVDLDGNEDIDKFEITPGSEDPYPTIQSTIYSQVEDGLLVTGSVYSGYSNIKEYYVIAVNSNLTDTPIETLSNFILTNSNIDAVYYQKGLNINQYSVESISHTFTNVFTDMTSTATEAVTTAGVYNTRILAFDGGNYGISANSSNLPLGSAMTACNLVASFTNDGISVTGTVSTVGNTGDYYLIAFTDPNLTNTQVKEYVTTNYSTYQNAIYTSNLLASTESTFTNTLSNIVDNNNDIVDANAVNFANVYLYAYDGTFEDMERSNIRPSEENPYPTLLTGSYVPYTETIDLTRSLFSGYSNIHDYYVTIIDSNLSGVTDETLSNFILTNSNSPAVYYEKGLNISQYDISLKSISLSNVFVGLSDNTTELVNEYYQNYKVKILAYDHKYFSFGGFNINITSTNVRTSNLIPAHDSENGLSLTAEVAPADSLDSTIYYAFGTTDLSLTNDQASNLLDNYATYSNAIYANKVPGNNKEVRLYGKTADDYSILLTNTIDNSTPGNTYEFEFDFDQGTYVAGANPVEYYMGAILFGSTTAGDSVRNTSSYYLGFTKNKDTSTTYEYTSHHYETYNATPGNGTKTAITGTVFPRYMKVTINGDNSLKLEGWTEMTRTGTAKFTVDPVGNSGANPTQGALKIGLWLNQGNDTGNKLNPDGSYLLFNKFTTGTEDFETMTVDGATTASEGSSPGNYDITKGNVENISENLTYVLDLNNNIVSSLNANVFNVFLYADNGTVIDRDITSSNIIPLSNTPYPILSNVGILLPQSNLDISASVYSGFQDITQYYLAAFSNNSLSGVADSNIYDFMRSNANPLGYVPQYAVNEFANQVISLVDNDLTPSYSLTTSTVTQNWSDWTQGTTVGTDTYISTAYGYPYRYLEIELGQSVQHTIGSHVIYRVDKPTRTGGTLVSNSQTDSYENTGYYYYYCATHTNMNLIVCVTRSASSTFNTDPVIDGNNHEVRLLAVDLIGNWRLVSVGGAKYWRVTMTTPIYNANGSAHGSGNGQSLWSGSKLILRKNTSTLAGLQYLPDNDTPNFFVYGLQSGLTEAREDQVTTPPYVYDPDEISGHGALGWMDSGSTYFRWEFDESVQINEIYYVHVDYVRVDICVNPTTLAIEYSNDGTNWTVEHTYQRGVDLNGDLTSDGGTNNQADVMFLQRVNGTWQPGTIVTGVQGRSAI